MAGQSARTAAKQLGENDERPASDGGACHGAGPCSSYSRTELLVIAGRFVP